MADNAANVEPMLPEWPKVRCDRKGCRTVYTLPEHKRHGLVSGDCPKCHWTIFSTHIGGNVQPPVTLDFATFKEGEVDA